jgi:branched-chain amino acid transport system permease protein
MHVALQTLVSSILSGGVLALIAMSLALVFGVLRIVNFAQADFMMLGMYGVVFLAADTHAPSLLLGILMFIPGVLLGAGIYKLLLVRRGGGGPSFGGFAHDQLLITFALSLIIESAAAMLFSGTPRTLNPGKAIRTWDLGGFALDQARVIAFVASVVIGVALLWYLNNTQSGRRIRATAADDVAAQIVGVNVARVRTVVFATSIGLAGVAGGILVGYYPVTPTTGANFLFYAFAALALGGLGNVLGALVGGLIIGIAQGIAQIFISLQLTDFVVFGIFLVVIFISPNGILGKAVRA